MEKRNRADCVAEISVYTSNLQQIAKCVYDSIKAKDIPSIVDCMGKFYAGYGAISGAILSYNGILTEEEVVKYLASITGIEREFRKTCADIANKLK
jgi:hypothetical protein